MTYQVNRGPVRIHCVSDEVEVMRVVVVLEKGYPRCKHGNDPCSPGARAVEAADLHRLGRRLDHSRNDHRSNRRVINPDVSCTAQLWKGIRVLTVRTEGIVVNRSERGERLKTLLQKLKVERDGVQSDGFCYSVSINLG